MVLYVLSALACQGIHHGVGVSGVRLMKTIVTTVFVCAALCSLAVGEDRLQPLSVHELEMKVHTEEVCISPDNDKLRLNDEIIPLQASLRDSGCKTVFGYLPYWSKDTAQIDYDLITHLGVFSVEVNSDGTLGNDHGWPWTSIINEAHAHGTKVILVATLFDPSGIYTLITNSTNKNRFFSNIKNKMLEGSADGLNIDFEGNGSFTSHINGFMADLTSYLHSEIPGCEVSFAGPAVNWSGQWDLPGLADSCDGIFVMGYAFWGSWSTTSGPNAPLTGGTYNITTTVMNHYGSADPAKLILGVPYYGHHWTTTSSGARSTVISFQGSVNFSTAEVGAQAYGRWWETASQTPWYRYYTASTWHQVWYDDAESIGLKYDLALNEDWQGVGMWSLGKDGTRSELWNLLEEKIGVCSPPPPHFDFNENRVLDDEDVLYLLWCMQGPDGTVPPVCMPGDADDDGDVDLQDYGVFCSIYAEFSE